MTEPWSDPGRDVLADLRAAVERGMSEPRRPLVLTDRQRAVIARMPDGDAALRMFDATEGPAREMYDDWLRSQGPRALPD